MEKPSLVSVFARFLRLGLTAFGGPAMIPYIRQATVEREQWLTDDSFKLGMAVSQLIPGATAMQMAAYVGLRARGGPGALLAYFGFGLPAFLLMVGLAAFYFASRDLPAVIAAFKGLQLVVMALMANAALNFARRYVDSATSGLLALGAALWFGLKGNPILVLVTVCILSIFVFQRDQGGHPVASPHPIGGRPLLSAAVFLGALVLFMGGVYIVTPDLFGLGLLMIKIDCFAFGGGYVSVPLMLHEVVAVHHWLSLEQFMDGIALGQVTPGPIVMTGAFVGYAVAGFIGAGVAAVTVFAPSLIFVCAATSFADRLISSPVARRVLKGSLISLVGLLASVTVLFAMSVEWDVAEIVFAAGALLALRLRADILWVVLGGAVLGALVL